MAKSDTNETNENGDDIVEAEAVEAAEDVAEAAVEAVEAETVEAPAEDDTAPEEAAEPVAAEEPAVEEPADEPVAAEEPAVEEPAEEPDAAEEPAVEEPAVEEPADEPVAAEEPAAEAVAPVEPKRKKKRLPRHLRPARTRRKRVVSEERKPIVRLPKPEGERGRRQERQGTVVSDAMDKTIVVKVDTIKAHRRYQKVVRRSVKLHAHDEGNQAKVGDIVRIVETRPLSATKHWRLVEIVEAAK